MLKRCNVNSVLCSKCRIIKSMKDNSKTATTRAKIVQINRMRWSILCENRLLQREELAAYTTEKRCNERKKVTQNAKNSR